MTFVQSVEPGRATRSVEAAQRLERGEILFIPPELFPGPSNADREFLASRSIQKLSDKRVTFDSVRGRFGGCTRCSTALRARLQRLLADSLRRVTQWLGGQFSRYRRDWIVDRVSYSPAEEATQSCVAQARNDLLHVDAFSARPTNGRRILRVFFNCSFSESRVWITSECFPRLLARFGRRAGLPRQGRSLQRVIEHLRRAWWRVWGHRSSRSEYDAFMLRLNRYLKSNEEVQERLPRRLWSFPPGSGWICMTDGLSHAELRGRHCLAHTYLVAPESLALPDEAPASLLARACGFGVLSHAA
jgi:3-deoxy-D-manno-octulosonic acid hydroxylase-like protein